MSLRQSILTFVLVLVTSMAAAPLPAAPPLEPSSAPATASATPAAVEPAKNAPPLEAGQVYILRPPVRQSRQLFEIEKTLVDLGLVGRSRVEPISGTLVVLCLPSKWPEAERVVKALSEQAPSTGAEPVKVRQVALETKVLKASATASPESTETLDPALVKKLGTLFGYRSFRVLGSQVTQVRVGDHADATSFLKDVESKEDRFLMVRYAVEMDGEDLAIKASLKIGDRGGELSTTFLARPNQSIIVGNGNVRAGNAFVYVLTPHVEMPNRGE
ncbi:MAG: hypothetical protein HY814_00320 [Candidatus Riflebacteria bacterium]|nr:hypothetical protein [Candidatus Riflebacteria bacterium]